jgi:hypothetical protein
VKNGGLRPRQQKKSMSIYEIRRAMQRGGARDPDLKQIAQSFSIAGADQDELVTLPFAKRCVAEAGLYRANRRHESC